MSEKNKTKYGLINLGSGGNKKIFYIELVLYPGKVPDIHLLDEEGLAVYYANVQEIKKDYQDKIRALFKAKNEENKATVKRMGLVGKLESFRLK